MIPIFMPLTYFTIAWSKQHHIHAANELDTKHCKNHLSSTIILSKKHENRIVFEIVTLCTCIMVISFLIVIWLPLKYCSMWWLIVESPWFPHMPLLGWQKDRIFSILVPLSSLLHFLSLVVAPFYSKKSSKIITEFCEYSCTNVLHQLCLVISMMSLFLLWLQWLFFDVSLLFWIYCRHPFVIFGTLFEKLDRYHFFSMCLFVVQHHPIIDLAASFQILLCHMIECSSRCYTEENLYSSAENWQVKNALFNHVSVRNN